MGVVKWTAFFLSLDYNPVQHLRNLQPGQVVPLALARNVILVAYKACFTLGNQLFIMPGDRI